MIAVVLLAAAVVDGATLNKRARLREGPSKDTPLLGWVEEGVVVTVESERSGWYSVRTPEGLSGYVWQDHLELDDATATPPASPPSTVAPTAIPAAAPTVTPPAVAPTGTIADEVRTLRTDVAALRERVDAGGGTELERLRTEVARLVTTQQELLQRLGRDAGQSGTDLGAETSAGPAALFLGAGALIGWIASRLFQGRRERRQRLRL